MIGVIASSIYKLLGINNLLPNGNFDNGLTGWTNLDGALFDTVEVVGGQLHLVANTTSSSIVHSGSTIPVEAGKMYLVSFDYNITSGSLSLVRFMQGEHSGNVTSLLGNLTAGSGTWYGGFVASLTETLSIEFYNYSGIFIDATFDNITIVEAVDYTELNVANAANELNEANSFAGFDSNRTDLSVDSVELTDGSYSVKGVSATTDSNNFIRYTVGVELGSIYRISFDYKPSTTNGRILIIDNIEPYLGTTSTPASWVAHDYISGAISTGNLQCRFYNARTAATIGDYCNVDKLSIKKYIMPTNINY